MVRWMVLGFVLLIAGCGLRPDGFGGGVANFGASQGGQGSGNGGS